jgi:Ser/Thr protein kinase RdoA (MazF antagonist)
VSKNNRLGAALSPVNDMETSSADAAELAHYSLSYPPLPDDVIKSVFRQHWIDDAVECALVQHSINDIYRVSVQERRFALKVYRGGRRSSQDIDGELAAIRYVGLRGANVAMPIARRDGQLVANIAAPEGSRHTAVFAWVDGGLPQYTDSAHSRRFGDLLARLHVAGRGFTPIANRTNIDVNYLLEYPLKIIGSNLFLPSNSAVRIKALAARLRAQLDCAEIELCSWGFCHGDVHPGNARINNGDIVIFDFDFYGLGWQIFDLATYRWLACRQAREIAWDSFTDAYLQVRPDAIGMLRFLGEFMILRHLWSTAHAITYSKVNGSPEISTEFFEDMVRFCENIEAMFPAN